MSSERPAKIIFSQPGPEDASSSDVQPLPFQTTVDVTAFVPTPARLVPPSEKQAAGLLPANVFVTSVDVENPDRFAVTDDGNALQTEEPLGRESTLPSTAAEPQDTVDFAEVARKWDNLYTVTDILQIQLGSLLAWKVRATYLRVRNPGLTTAFSLWASTPSHAHPRFVYTSAASQTTPRITF